MNFGPLALAAALGIGRRRVAQALAARLTASPEPEHPTLVWGEALGAAVAQAGVQVVVAAPARHRSRGPEPILTRPEALPFADAVYDAALADGLPLGGAEGGALVTELVRVVRPGGVVAVVDPAAPVLGRVAPRDRTLALFLHAGVAELEQRVVGPYRLTFGRVRRLPRRARSGAEAAAS